MTTWGTSAWNGAFLITSGSWGDAGNYSKTLTFYNLGDNLYVDEGEGGESQGGVFTPSGIGIYISSDDVNYTQITEMERGWASTNGRLTEEELRNFTETIDFSKYVTPVSGTYI